MPAANLPDPCDLVVFSAHPDDAELCAGGLLRLAALQGRRAAVVDCTRGELGSRGTPEIRAAEAAEAAATLGLAERINLGLPDGAVRDTDDARREVVRVIRTLRPRIVVAPPLDDHHPDHMGVAELLVNSFYLGGIRKYPPTELPPHRPRALLHHMGTRPMVPDLVVDISAVMEDRMKAVCAYRSQFERSKEDDEGFQLRIAAERFLHSIESTMSYFGSLIGVPYGEPYTSETPVPVTDLFGLYSTEPWKS